MKTENEPRIGNFIDEEERALYEAIENDDNYTPTGSQLTATRKTELQEAARNTINGKRTKITIRVDDYDLLRLKAQALKEGIPYQTWINSILHKAARS